MERSQMYLAYAGLAGEGDITRLEAARIMGVHKSTATYHLDRAVSQGVLERYQGWTTENQYGWIYRIPGSNLPLPFEGMEDSQQQPEWQEVSHNA